VAQITQVATPVVSGYASDAQVKVPVAVNQVSSYSSSISHDHVKPVVSTVHPVAHVAQVSQLSAPVVSKYQIGAHVIQTPVAVNQLSGYSIGGQVQVPVAVNQVSGYSSSVSHDQVKPVVSAVHPVAHVAQVSQLSAPVVSRYQFWSPIGQAPVAVNQLSGYSSSLNHGQLVQSLVHPVECPFPACFPSLSSSFHRL